MADMRDTDSFFLALARELELLKDSNRAVRKCALEKISQSTLNVELVNNYQSFQEVVKEIHKPLLNTLTDPVERCRELCAEILLEFANRVDNPSDMLPFITPALLARLALPELVEPSEEVRLLEMRMIETLVCRSIPEDLIPYLNDVVAILRRTLTDPFPEIRKTSCNCAIHLAKVLPDHFHFQGESLLNPLLLSLTHQHAKVRCACVQAIGVIVEFGNNHLVDSVAPHFAQRLFDQSPIVRCMVASVAGHWMMELRDRTIYYHKLLPLLLTCISDEVPEVHDIAQPLWDEVGEKYLLENEEKVKDLIDFPKQPPDHYPPQVPRPSFGCRYLVQSHLGQILPAVLHDMYDWVSATRIKASTLLYQLLLHAEEKVTRYLEKVIAALVKHGNDQERNVVIMVELCSELLGYFVRPDIWCDKFLPVIRQYPTSSHLLCLAAMLRRSNRVEMDDYLSAVTKVLAEPKICRTIDPLTLYYLVTCMDSLLVSCGDRCCNVGLNIFSILVTADALADSESQITEKVAQCLVQLEQEHCLSEGLNLYSIYAKPFLELIKEDHDAWELQTIERVIFTSFLLSSGESTGENLDNIIPVFVNCLHQNKDPQLRLKLLTVLSSLLFKADETLNSRNDLPTYVPDILSGVILPNVEWHGGRTAAALRSASVSCFWALAKGLDLDAQLLSPFSEDLSKQLSVLLEDESQMTRLMTCKVLIQILPSLLASEDVDLSHQLGNALLKRMDDVSDDIRIVVTKVLASFYLCCLDQEMNEDDWEEVFQRLLIHLDDNQARVREAVLELLKQIGRFSPYVLLEQVKHARSKHRTLECCDELVNHIESLHLSNSH